MKTRASAVPSRLTYAAASSAMGAVGEEGGLFGRGQIGEIHGSPFGEDAEYRLELRFSRSRA